MCLHVMMICMTQHTRLEIMGGNDSLDIKGFDPNKPSEGSEAESRWGAGGGARQHSDRRRPIKN